MSHIVAQQAPTKTNHKSHPATKIAHAPAARHLNISALEAPHVQRAPACACGGGCPRCIGAFSIQPKLKIGEPNDKYEQEADRVADQIMRMPESGIQRQPT